MVKISSGLPLGSTKCCKHSHRLQVGTDVIGIAGLSGVTGFDDLTLRQSGMDAVVTPDQPSLDSHSHRVQGIP